MSILQPVHLRYGFLPGDSGQPIPTVNRATGGEGLKINFSEDLEDPAWHHPNAGGISIINGPGSSTGYDVWGTISLWIRDLWAPDPASRTEIQTWISLAEVLPGGGSGATVDTRPAQEHYAPLQHDDLVWGPDGQVSASVEGHDYSTLHLIHPVQPIYVPADRRLRVHIAQFHDAALVPGYGLPWPGHIRKAWADLIAVPR